MIALLPLLLAAAVPTPANLQVVLYPNGTSKSPVVWVRLRCGPPGGTHPHRVAACATLARLAHPFAPTPPTVMCSDVYSGPQVAYVRGTFRGVRVNARFSRTNSCETARWNRVAPVLRID